MCLSSFNEVATTSKCTILFINHISFFMIYNQTNFITKKLKQLLKLPIISAMVMRKDYESFEF